jgi:signal transduction histidine kinase
MAWDINWRYPMVYRHSLQYRIIKNFCIFASFLSLFYAVFIFVSIDYLEDYLEDKFYRKQIQGELNTFLSQYRLDKSIEPPRSPYLSIYVDRSSLPKDLKQMVDGRPDGLYEVEDVGEEKEIVHSFLIQTIPETRQTVYLFYDSGFLEISKKRIIAIFFILAAGYVIVFFMSIWIGRTTSRKVIEPVRYLSEIVKKTEPENLPTDLSASFYDDEVGTLAQALEHAMRRIRLFIQREQQFTRNASHELRTPVTVIKGAVELLKQNPGVHHPGIRPPVLRIDRAALDMEDTIDSFLWLSREKDDLKSDEKCNVFKLINDTISQHQHLIENKSLVLDLINEADLQINAPRSLLKIVLGNMIKNAFNYTISGDIKVFVKSDRVCIQDTGIGISSEVLAKVTEPGVRGQESQGLGIGLAIVKMICDRMGWHFEIQSNTENGTTVQVIFMEGTRPS